MKWAPLSAVSLEFAYCWAPGWWKPFVALFVKTVTSLPFGFIITVRTAVTPHWEALHIVFTRLQSAKDTQTMLARCRRKHAMESQGYWYFSPSHTSPDPTFKTRFKTFLFDKTGSDYPEFSFMYAVIGLDCRGLPTMQYFFFTHPSLCI